MRCLGKCIVDSLKLKVMSKEKDNNQLSGEAVTSMAVAASTKFLLEHIESTVGVSSAFAKAPEAACRLLAAGALYLGKILSDDNNDKALIENLEKTKMDVAVDEKGQVSTTVSTVPPDEQAQPLVIEQTVEGRVYHIQNLQFCLDIKEVQQLNVNPKEVINHLTEELKKQGI